MYFCPICSGTTILRDAFVDMNTDAVIVFDSIICHDCGIEVDPTEAAVTPDDLDFARETLGPNATRGDVLDLALQRIAEEG